MKKLIKAVITSSILVYLISIFITMEYNIWKWEPADRAMLVIGIIVPVIAYYMVINLEKDCL